jgi:hypothetical protein
VRRRVRNRDFRNKISKTTPCKVGWGRFAALRPLALPPLRGPYNATEFSADPGHPALRELMGRCRRMRCPNAAHPIYSGEYRLPMNAFSSFGDHLDCERGPDGGFEATYVRGKVFCEGDGFRSE